MTDPVEYGPMEAGEEVALSELARIAFDRHVAGGCTAVGLDEYERFTHPSAIVGRRDRGESRTLVAREAGRIVGLIEFRPAGHVMLLDVDPDCHRRGIARELFERALAFIRETDPAPEAITVNSSRYAVPVYGQFGFAPTGPEQVKSGLRFTPMRLELPADAAD